MHGRPLVAATALLMLGACGATLDGTWLGDMDCGQVPYNLEITLEKSEGIWVGDGEQSRKTTSIDGQETEIVIEFDISLEKISGSGAQDLITEMTCTSNVQVVDGEDVGSGCVPLQYRDAVIGWDGKDAFTISDPDEDCAGDLARR